MHGRCEKLIALYPPHKGVDAVLARMGDDTFLREGECPYIENEKEGTSEEDDGDTTSGAEGSPEALGVADALAEEQDESRLIQTEVTKDMGHMGSRDVSAQCAEKVTKSAVTISAMETAIEALRELGALQAVANLENEIRKEKRRQRGMSREDDHVAYALARKRDEEEIREQKRRRMVEECNQRSITQAKLNQQNKEAAALLRKYKQDLHDTEKLLEMKHAMKTFTLDDLGNSRSRGNVEKGKKKRLEVLDRLSRLSEGLSAAQRNDFTWWKEAWDTKMLREHEDDWPRLFMGWVQKVMDDFQVGVNNAFSLFVHNETIRCLEQVPALQVP